MLPIVLITFLLIAMLAHYIAKPLRLLADSANLSTDKKNVEHLKGIKSWYFESQQLKHAMLEGVHTLQSQMGQLRQDALTDPLTGAHNSHGVSFRDYGRDGFESTRWVCTYRNRSLSNLDSPYQYPCNEHLCEPCSKYRRGCICR